MRTPIKELDGRFRWGSFSAIQGRRPDRKKRAGKRRYRDRERGPPTSHRPLLAWVSPDAVAARHGAELVYVVRGRPIERVDWDLVEWTVHHLLGYAYQPHGLGAPVLFQALQEVALMWPPPDSFRAAIHEVVDRWGSNPRVDRTRWKQNVLRLRRARGLLETWSGGRDGDGERAAS